MSVHLALHQDGLRIMKTLGEKSIQSNMQYAHKNVGLNI